MACANCKCDAEPTEGPYNPDQRLDDYITINSKNLDHHDAQLKAMEEFLMEKFPNELKTKFVRGTLQWLYEKNQAANAARRLELNIRELTAQGYIVAKPEAPAEPTLEASIRDVILTNTPVK